MLKPAYDLHVTSPNLKSRGPNLNKNFSYDLAHMFYEKGQSGDCYKSFAKWDMPFGREEDMHEMIMKRDIQDDEIESKFS